MLVSDIVRQARRSAGLSQASLARLAETSQSALARYESGAAIPAIPTLERVLHACGQQLQLRSVAIHGFRGTKEKTSMRGQLGSRARDLRRHRRQLLNAAGANGIRKVRVFGSVARGDADDSSDIDFLVELAPGRTLLDLAAFRRQAEQALGTRVDVATEDMLKRRIRSDVVAEAVPL